MRIVGNKQNQTGEIEMTDLRDILLKLIEIETQIIKGFSIVIEYIEEMKEEKAKLAFNS
jgi:hypothetical protein